MTDIENDLRDLGYRQSVLRLDREITPNTIWIKPFGGLILAYVDNAIMSVFKHASKGGPLVLEKCVGVFSVRDIVLAEETLVPALCLRTSRFTPAEILQFLI